MKYFWGLVAFVFGLAFFALLIVELFQPLNYEAPLYALDDHEVVLLPLTEEDFLALAAEPGAIVIDLQYRGLDPGKGDAERYSGVNGFSEEYYSRFSDASPFVEAVRGKFGKVDTQRFPLLGDAQVCATTYEEIESTSQTETESLTTFSLEYLNAKRVEYFLHLDLNANGIFDDTESFSFVDEPMGVDYRSPLIKERDYIYDYCVSPDIVVKNTNGEFLYRFVGLYAYNSMLFNASCIWEGSTELNGKPMTIQVYDINLNARFGDFGNDAVALLDGESPQPLGERQVLSSLVRFRDKYYQLRFQGIGRSGEPFRAVLVPDARPVGEFQVKLEFPGVVTSTTLDSLWVFSEDAPAMRLDVVKEKIKSLPEGLYWFTSGDITFGNNRSDLGKWRTCFTSGPSVDIRVGEHRAITLGPSLQGKIFPHRENEGVAEYQVEEGVTTVSLGTSLTIVYELTGPSNEKYNGISAGGGCFWESVNTKLEVLGPDGTPLVTEPLEPGRGGNHRYLLDTSDLVAGKYDVRMFHESGPLVGKAFYELEFTLVAR